MKRSILLIAAPAFIGLLLLTWNSGYFFRYVVSNSMYHNNVSHFYAEWEKKEYKMEAIDELPFSTGFKSGDLLIFRKTNELNVGDVGIFNYPCKSCEDNIQKSSYCKYCAIEMTHRVHSKNGTHYVFKGDAFVRENKSIAYFYGLTQYVPKHLVKGKAAVRIPYVGIPGSVFNCLFLSNTCSIKSCVSKGDCI